MGIAFDDDYDDRAIPRNGGARPNSGIKKPGYQKAAEVVEFDKARARNEQLKAEKNEIELEVLRTKYVAREAVAQATSHLLANLTQTLRSIGDRMEHEGVPVDLCAKVERIVEQALSETAAQLELMADGAS